MRRTMAIELARTASPKVVAHHETHCLGAEKLLESSFLTSTRRESATNRSGANGGSRKLFREMINWHFR